MGTADDAIDCSNAVQCAIVMGRPSLTALSAEWKSCPSPVRLLPRRSPRQKPRGSTIKTACAGRRAVSARSSCCPVLAAITVFRLPRSDVYVSESRFVVRSPEKPAATGLGVDLADGWLHDAARMRSMPRSRSLVRGTRCGRSIATARSNALIPGLIFSSSTDSIRSASSARSRTCYQYFEKKVSLKNDSQTSITTLTVRAYDPDDAYRFNQQAARNVGADSKSAQRARPARSRPLRASGSCRGQGQGASWPPSTLQPIATVRGWWIPKSRPKRRCRWCPSCRTS